MRVASGLPAPTRLLKSQVPVALIRSEIPQMCLYLIIATTVIYQAHIVLAVWSLQTDVA